MKFSAALALFVAVCAIAGASETTDQPRGERGPEGQGRHGHHHVSTTPVAVAALKGDVENTIVNASDNMPGRRPAHGGPEGRHGPPGEHQSEGETETTTPAVAALNEDTESVTRPEHEHHHEHRGSTTPAAAALNEVRNAVTNVSTSIPDHRENGTRSEHGHHGREEHEHPEGEEHEHPEGEEHQHAEGEERDHIEGEEHDHTEGEEHDHTEGEEDDHLEGEENDQTEGEEPDHEEPSDDGENNEEPSTAALVKTLKSIHRERRCFRSSTTVTAA